MKWYHLDSKWKWEICNLAIGFSQSDALWYHLGLSWHYYKFKGYRPVFEGIITMMSPRFRCDITLKAIYITLKIYASFCFLLPKCETNITLKVRWYHLVCKVISPWSTVISSSFKVLYNLLSDIIVLWTWFLNSKCK